MENCTYLIEIQNLMVETNSFDKWICDMLQYVQLCFAEENPMRPEKKYEKQ